MKSIDEKMSEEALLEQLLEECGELVQAGAKRLRILRGESPTPVTKVQNLRNLTEELGDVSLCIGVLCDKLQIREDVHNVAKVKEERWEQRLNGLHTA